MDNRAWGPRPVAIVLVGLVGLAMAAGTVLLATDRPGRILAGVAAIGLLVFAAGSWRARPRLALRGPQTNPELVYRGWLRTRTLTHADIERIRITEFRRFGRRIHLLEIDTTAELIVLNRWDLGGDPLAVLDALTDAGYAGR